MEAHEPHESILPRQVETRAVAATVAVLVAVTAALGLAAWGSEGTLLTWDEPALNAMVDHRITPLDWFFLGGTVLGGNVAVVPLAAVAAWAVRDRSRAIAVTVVAVMAAHLVLEVVIKAAVDRPRPDVDALETYGAASFPSGHVLGAVAFWGVVPLVVSALTPDPRARRRATAISIGAIVVVAVSRVYIGVHYPSDVIGSLALGAALLLTAHLVLDRSRERPPPVPDTPEPPSP